jgi:hypothetical protein
VGGAISEPNGNTFFLESVQSKTLPSGALIVILFGTNVLAFVFKRAPFGPAAPPGPDEPEGPEEVDGVGGGDEILFEWLCDIGCVDGDGGSGWAATGRAGAWVGVPGCNCGGGLRGDIGNGEGWGPGVP